ncbi:MAG TPA: serine protease [Candidatus Doudnabacteria bacterium]|nr:serine protease [Candidatus Doudnabacteria bacterium]
MTATLLIVGAVFYYNQNLDARTAIVVAEANDRKQKMNIPNEAKAIDVSRKIMAQLYNNPALASGSILGEITPVPLKQEEIADITTPTVVRIFNQSNGTVTIPEFNVDLVNFKLVPNSTNYTGQVETGNTGTGFFVDSAGHILTNAHVVDKNIILEKFTDQALEYYLDTILTQLMSLNQQEAEVIRQRILDTYSSDIDKAAILFAYDLLETIMEYIQEKSIVNAKQVITVLDPGQTGISINNREDLVKLANQSIPANLIATNLDYESSGKDVAIIKIQHPATPFLSLNTTSKGSAGQQIYIIGFPQSAELSSADLLSKSMTQGTISSVRNFEGIEVYQTDAKINQGSSGSPMINDKGEVIGIVSFLTIGGIGDGFGFAVPIEHGNDLMVANGIRPSANPYMESFKQGVTLAQNNLCRKANEQFELSRSLNQTFNNPSLQKYIDRCDEMIAAGTSKDGFTYQAMEKIKTVPVYLWLGLLALIGISIGAIILLIFSRKSAALPQLQSV